MTVPIEPNGFLLVDKPAGWTSFDVVAKIRGLLEREWRQATGQKRRIKVGHSGTLDPMATGLLVLAVGPSTKQLPELLKQTKTYEATVTLGSRSTSGDADGQLTKAEQLVLPTESVVRAAVESFIGPQLQTPPAFSAIKASGQRAYELARAGKPVALESRPITIYAIKDIKYRWPIVKFTAEVSSGTYIRSLAMDLGEKLGCGAYLSGLRRTGIGPAKLQGAIGLDGIDAAAIRAQLRREIDRPG